MRYLREPALPCADQFVRSYMYATRQDGARLVITRTVWFIDRRGEEDSETDTWTQDRAP